MKNSFESELKQELKEFQVEIKQFSSKQSEKIEKQLKIPLLEILNKSLQQQKQQKIDNNDNNNNDNINNIQQYNTKNQLLIDKTLFDLLNWSGVLSLENFDLSL